MKIIQFELWQCARQESLFDAAHAGASPMPWDVVVLRLTAETGEQGVATACAARSGRITAAFLKEIIAPVVLGREATDREAIWHELNTLDRHLTFFPLYLPGPVDVALWDLAAKAAGLPLFRYLGACRTALPVYGSSLWFRDAADIVRADVSWKPGITGTLKITHLAEAHGLQCELHTTTMGPMDIASLHVSCAIRNCEYFELLLPEDTFRFPMRDPYPIDGAGWIHVPEKPGLGIELDWEAIQRSCVDHQVLRA